MEIYKKILRAGRCLPAMALIYICGFALLAPAQMIATQRVVDSLMEEGRGGVLLISIALLAATYLLMSWKTSVRDILKMKLEKAVMYQLMPEFIDKGCRLSYDTMFLPETRNLMSRLSDEPYVKLKNNMMDWIEVGSGIVAFLSLLIYLGNISGPMAAMSVLILVAFIWSDYKFTSILRRVVFEQSSEMRESEYYGKLLIDRYSLCELSLFGAVKSMMKRYGELVEGLYRVRLKETLRGQTWLAASCMLTGVWIAFVLFEAAHLFQSGEISYGTAVAWLGGAFEMAGLADVLSMNFSRAFSSSEKVWYYGTFLKLSERQEVKEDNYPDNESEFDIVLKDVSYTYPGEKRKAVDHLSMRLHSRDRAALVGENGSGKSTIVKLICGVIEPDEGQITIAHRPAVQFADSVRKKYVAAAFQDVVKYPFSLQENITIGSLEHADDRERLMEVLKLLGVEGWESDLDSQLGKFGKKGTDLSSGQWQWVSLARILFSSAQFLILDEPAAALDPVKESRIYENFLKIAEKKGLLIISHRMPSAKLADCIYVVKDGAIAEQGRHGELMKKQGVYADLYGKQAAWYQERRDEKN